LGATFETVVPLVSAGDRVLILMAQSTRDLAERRIHAQPFGATEAADWSLPALGIASVAPALSRA
jgi:hypothetical protein